MDLTQVSLCPMAKKNKKISLKHLSPITIGFLIIGLIWGSVKWVEYRTYLEVTNFTYEGSIQIPMDEYAGLIKDITQSSSRKIDLTEIQERIGMHPYVKAVRVSHTYPSTIKIEIVERSALAVLNGGVMVFLDEDCFVMPEVGNLADLKVPILSNYNPNPTLYPTGGKARSVKVQESIQLLKKIKNEYETLYQNISEMSLNTNDEFIIVLVDQPTKIRLGRTNIWAKLLVLREFEKTILGQKRLSDYAYLDMRYNNQVIAKERL
jgi:cell division protein FtsQ